MKKKYFVVIAVVHLLLVVTDLLLYNYQLGADSHRYLAAANDFASFNFAGMDAAVHCNTAPGYPIFLALTKIITWHQPIMIAIVQGLVFCLALYYLLANLFAKGYLSYAMCLAAYALALFSPDMFQTNVMVLTESLCASALVLSCGCVVTGFQKKSTTILFVIGTCFLVLTKFEYIVALPFLFFPLILKRKYKPLFAAIFFLAVILSLNTWKNYFLYKKVSPFSFGSGSAMYGGNNMNGDGSWHFTIKNLNYLPPGKQEQFLATLNCESKCLCLTQDSLFKAWSKEAWKNNPAFQLKIIPYKFLKLWLIPSGMDFYTRMTEFKPGLQLNILFDDTIWPWYGKYKHGFYLTIYWLYVIALLAGFGIKVLQDKFRSADFFVLLLFVMFSFIYSTFFYGLGRFHIPVFSLLVLYAVFTIKFLDARLLKSAIFTRLEKLNQKQKLV
jgi:hypothetical protein